jgi:hypothetical protein
VLPQAGGRIAPRYTHNKQEGRTEVPCSRQHGDAPRARLPQTATLGDFHHGPQPVGGVPVQSADARPPDVDGNTLSVAFCWTEPDLEDGARAAKSTRPAGEYLLQHRSCVGVHADCPLLSSSPWNARKRAPTWCSAETGGRRWSCGMSRTAVRRAWHVAHAASRRGGPVCARPSSPTTTCAACTVGSRRDAAWVALACDSRYGHDSRHLSAIRWIS